MTLCKEDLQAIRELLNPMEEQIDSLKTDAAGMITDIISIKADIDELKPMKQEIANLRLHLEHLTKEIKTIQLHLENETDRNIQILAENHCNLIDKINQALPAADKSLVYEVKVTYLIKRVAELETEIDKMKGLPKSASGINSVPNAFVRKTNSLL